MVFNRDISLSLISSSWLCIPWRLRICLPCCSCICCIWAFKSSMLLSRLTISSCSSALLCSSSFSLPLPKREPTPLAMAVAASVATLLSLSVRISDFTCLSSCSASSTCCSLCRFAASMRCSSAFCFSIIKSFRSKCSLPVTFFDWPRSIIRMSDAKVCIAAISSSLSLRLFPVSWFIQSNTICAW